MLGAVLMVACLGVGASARVVRPAAVRNDLAWAAIGDSYSSGEGIPGTSTKTDWHGNNCQRADGDGTNALAWGPGAERLVAGDIGVKTFAFTACTGATTDAAPDQLNEAVSLHPGTNRWDIVTFSFGGNNIGFADIIKGCLDVNGWGVFDLTPGCDISEQVLRDRIDMLVGKRLPGPGYTGITLPALYDTIANQVRPGGDVIVLGYPQVVEEVGRWDGWRRNVLGNCEGIQSYDVGMLRSAAGYLNQQIALAVQAADQRHAAQGVHFTFEDIATKVYETGAAADQRHALCAKKPWLNGQTTSAGSGDFRTSRSFHPTQQGHNATASDLAQVLRYDIHFDDAPTTTTTTTTSQVPTLGGHWAPDTEGFGEVKPANVSNGGDPTGVFSDIVWDSWGGAQATGHGTGWWYDPDRGEDVAGGHSEPIGLVAYDLQQCGGGLMYRHLAVFFPEHGESFDPATNGETDYDLCPSGNP
jgi:hypothetical protein